MKIALISAGFLFLGLGLMAQETSGVQNEIRKMSRETDPATCIAMKDRIIREYKLDTLKDTETADVMNGTIAVAFALRKDNPDFEKYIGLIRNKFNQTSMMNMAAAELLAKKVDADYAGRIAKETIDRYDAFKDDPEARPAGYTKEDWDRFMRFAKYPYYDTYAQSLFERKKYPEALKYQEMAFQGPPEEGLPGSVERYARLLELNGEKEEARQLLLKMAKTGKLSGGMADQLKSLTAEETGSSKGAEKYVDSLQSNIPASLIQELRPKLLNESAPAFSLKDIDGKTVRLSDYRGKVVILDLWATWCVPCKASFPAMKKEVEKHPEVVFLFIAVQEKGANALDRVKKYIRESKYPFHVLMDEPVAGNPNQSVILSAYRPEGIPAKYFIDRQGKIRFKAKGFSTDQELMNEMDAVIAILKGL